MLSALRGGNLLGFLSQLAYNSGILSKFDKDSFVDFFEEDLL